MRLETAERKENVDTREFTDITERRMQCVSTITSTSERLKCLFCQKVPRLINYSGIGRNSREGIAIAGEKMALSLFLHPSFIRSAWECGCDALRHIKVKAIE